MTIVVLLSLLIIGLILMLAEVLFVPGTTIVGILGLVVSLLGISYAFISYEANTAWVITGIAALANLVAIVYGFRSGVWNKFSLKNTSQGRVFDGRTSGLYLGMEGKAISDIKPFGKGLFGEKIYEVKSENGFLTVGSDLEIIKIENNKILVK